MEKVIYYNDGKGNKIPVKINLNKNLVKKPKEKRTKKSKENKNSKLYLELIAGALVIAIGVGACVPSNNNKPGYSVSTPDEPNGTNPEKNDEINSELRFDPNSKEAIIEKATFLVEEAARCGKQLDAEDAVLAVIAANANEMKLGFMGQLFGDKANQTHTYSSLVDAYLRVCMMQSENVGFAKNDDIAFNIENIFSNAEDYKFLCDLRNLTNRYNNSTDSQEKAEIVAQLNNIAADLCGYDVYDISSSAGIIAMLTLDGMRTTTIATNNPVLHNDIRDEMFGNGDYACTTNGTYTAENGQVMPTAYSFRVSDLKLDTIKTKLENAFLADGQSIIFGEIVSQVEEKTKNIEIADINMADEINKTTEENRDVTYEYENVPGSVKDGYSEKSEDDVVQNVGGKDVIVQGGGTNKPSEPEKPTPTEPTPSTPSQPESPTEPEIPTAPEIKQEDNVTPESDEEIFDDREQAEEELQNDWEKAQADSNQGCIDGEYYGKNGLPKPSFEGKSEFYINAFNTNYDFWYNKYLQNQNTNSSASVSTTAEYDISQLSRDQLTELKNAAMGEEEYTQDTVDKTKTM